MRGFADSMDHLLDALEEFYPFIEKLSSRAEHFRYPKHRMMRGRGRRPPRFWYPIQTERMDSGGILYSYANSQLLLLWDDSDADCHPLDHPMALCRSFRIKHTRQSKPGRFLSWTNRYLPAAAAATITNATTAAVTQTPAIQTAAAIHAAVIPAAMAIPAITLQTGSGGSSFLWSSCIWWTAAAATSSDSKSQPVLYHCMRPKEKTWPQQKTAALWMVHRTAVLLFKDMIYRQRQQQFSACRD